MQNYDRNEIIVIHIDILSKRQVEIKCPISYRKVSKKCTKAR
jgi:hypothetical protein